MIICGDWITEFRKLPDESGVILDPFAGAGTTGVVAKKNNRDFIGIELNPEYIEMAEARINNTIEPLQEDNWEEIDIEADLEGMVNE